MSEQQIIRDEMGDNEKLIEEARAAIKPTDSIELVRAFEHLARFEPSDAQVEAAHEAFWLGYDGKGGREAIRDALRAASAAGRKGEPKRG